MTAPSVASSAASIPRWATLSVGALSLLTGALIAWDPALTSVVFFTFFVAILAWWRPAAVISGLAFYIPLERSITARLPELAFVLAQISGEVVLLALLAGILARKAAAGRRFTATPVDVALLGFIAACVLSAIVNGVSAQATVYGIRIVLRYAIVYYAIVNGGFSRDQIRTFLRVFLAAVVVQIAVGLLQALTGGAAKDWFIAAREVSVGGVAFVRGQDTGTGEGLFTVIFGTLEDYNSYGHFMSLAFVLLFAIAGRKGCFAGRGTLRTVLILALVCIALSFSRSSLLISVIGVAVVLLAQGNRKAALAILFVLAVGLAGIILMGYKYSGQDIPVYTTSFFYRWVRPFTPERLELTDVGNYRLFLLFVVASRALSQAPIFGFGPGTFGSALTKTGSPEIYERLGMNYEYAGLFAADSNWTTIVAQTGLLGLLFFCLVIFGLAGFCGRAGAKTSDPMLKALCWGQLGVTAALVLAGFFSSAFENRFTAYYFWAVSGLVVALARSEGFRPGRGILARLLRPNGSARRS